MVPERVEVRAVFVVLEELLLAVDPRLSFEVS
jgi:hypothetical protein